MRPYSLGRGWRDHLGFIRAQKSSPLCPGSLHDRRPEHRFLNAATLTRTGSNLWKVIWIHLTPVFCTRIGTRSERKAMIAIDRSSVPTRPLYSARYAPVIEVEDTIFGFHMSAVRNAEQNGKPVKYARIHSYALPWMCIVPPNTHTFEIPIDDEHVSVILAISDPNKKVDRAAIEKVYGAEEMYKVMGPSVVKHFTGDARNRWHQTRAECSKMAASAESPAS